MSPANRVALACQMSDEMRAVTADGLRDRRPGASDAEIEIAVRRLLLGADLADRIGLPR